MSQSSPIPPTDVPCPFCEAPVGVPCDPEYGYGLTFIHMPTHLVAHHSRINASEAQQRLPLGQSATEAVSRSEGSTKTKEE